MKTIISLSVLLLFGALTLSAQQPAPVTMSGYVVDQMCAKGIAKKADPMEKAAAHTRECALEEGCAASGFGIFSDGKYYPFDEKGSASAKTLLEKSKRKAGMYFEASGKLADGKLIVATLKETPPPEKKAEKKG